MGKSRRFIFSAIVVGLVAIAFGFSVAKGWLPAKAAEQQYGEKTWTDTTVRRVIHAYDGLPEHEHIITAVVTTTETTPHGTFHDFASVGTAQLAVAAPAAAVPAQVVNPAQVAAPAPGADKAQAKYEIIIAGREFAPTTLTVPVGANVTWINKDGEMHTVRSDKFAGGLAPLASFSFTPTETGVYDYHCETRPEMTGTIIVR